MSSHPYPPAPGYGQYPPAPPARGSGARTARAIVAWVALGLAALLTVPAVVAYWAHTTIASQQGYVAAVAQVGADPVVKKVIAEEVSAAVTKRLDLGALNSAVESIVFQLAMQAMGTKAYTGAWEQGNAAAQQEIVAALTGRDSGVTVSGNDVMLDASGLLEGIKSGLVSQGLGIAASLEVPKGEMQIRLMDAATLSRLQGLYRMSSPFGGWAIYLVGALYLLALLVAPRRGPVLTAAGLALAVSGLLVAGVVALGEAAFRSQLSGQPFAPAAGMYWQALAAPLTQWWPVLVGVGAIAAVAGGVWWVVAARSRAR